MDVTQRSSPLALAVLCMLEAGPMHPYGLQRLIKLWGKDQVVNVGQRATLYKTIKRLHQAGLIAVRQTERDQQFPERTVYELTDQGHEQAHEWLVDMLSTPRNEYPEFPAALSFTMLLGPDGTIAALERRIARLDEARAKLEHELGGHYDHLPRVTLLESEYLRAVAVAELDWLNGIVADLRSGALTWTFEELAAAAAQTDPSE